MAHTKTHSNQTSSFEHSLIETLDGLVAYLKIVQDILLSVSNYTKFQGCFNTFSSLKSG